ncbi:MAG: thiamine pyrophosphate-dependent dehydrogenase E1 component subunit alpha [Bradymonadia bacterium]
MPEVEVKRYAALEFPEYANWAPNDDVMREFDDTINADEHRKVLIEGLDKAELLDIYRGLVTARLHDIQLKRWVRQGVITKAWLGTGEEAVTVGVCRALGENDVVGPMIRNAAALMERGVPLTSCFAAYLGTTDSITQGRDLHIGDPNKGVIPPISHIGDLVPVMAGCALAFKQRGEKRVAVTWTGDGSTATGAFHEGIRVAASMAVPYICIIQNNQVALGTSRTHHSPGMFESFGAAYGVPLLRMSGNHVLDCYATTKTAVEMCHAGQGPVLIVADTFRMGGHATHDEREARSLFDETTYKHWGDRDPIGMYETYLTNHHQVSSDALETIEKQVIADIDEAAKKAVAKVKTHQPDPETVGDGVYRSS